MTHDDTALAGSSAGKGCQTITKPGNPKSSEGKGVCGETIRVSLRVQSNSFSNFFESLKNVTSLSKRLF